jgi:hypothetical protein
MCPKEATASDAQKKKRQQQATLQKRQQSIYTTMAAILSHRQRRSIQVLMALVLLACYHNSLRVRSYLLCAALVPPSRSPWRKLYDEGDSSSFLHITGLTREAFDRLLYVVIPPGHSLRMRHRGRPWSLPPDGMLGLLLCYLGSQMTIK